MLATVSGAPFMSGEGKMNVDCRRLLPCSPDRLPAIFYWHCNRRTAAKNVKKVTGHILEYAADAPLVNARSYGCSSSIGVAPMNIIS